MLKKLFGIGLIIVGVMLLLIVAFKLFTAVIIVAVYTIMVSIGSGAIVYGLIKLGIFKK
jgi:hypothetical protein